MQKNPVYSIKHSPSLVDVPETEAFAAGKRQFHECFGSLRIRILRFNNGILSFLSSTNSSAPSMITYIYDQYETQRNELPRSHAIMPFSQGRCHGFESGGKFCERNEQKIFF